MLLSTKLRPPQLPGDYLSRPRLLAQLDRGLSGGLILISAPAGYGKTTLVADWLHHMSLGGGQRSASPCAWVSLDESDNDLYLFLRYVITAVRTAFRQESLCTATESLLDAAQLPPLEAITTSFINDLNTLPDQLLLALDDYHLITSPKVQQLMDRLVHYFPAGLRLVLITRVDPPLPLLSRRRAQARLLEIRAADLRFTPAEAYAVLQGTTDTAVTLETAVALDKETEGWIIGLQMAGLSLRDQADPVAFARTLRQRGRRLAMDFLLDEVLIRQPRPLFEFLLQTSILERFCAPLCTAVFHAAEPSAQQVPDYLDRLERTNLFLVSLDEQKVWYRFHHLFRDLLRQRLAQEYEPETIASLHKHAGVWLAEHKLIEEALRHLLIAGDVDTAVSLIEANRLEVLNREDFRTVERWLSMLPEDVVNTRPSLLLMKAWVMRIDYKLSALPAVLKQVEALQTDVPTGDQHALIIADSLQGESDTLWSEIYFWDSDFRRTHTSGRSALALLPKNYYFARGLAVLYKCQALQAFGQLEKAIILLNEALADEEQQHLAFRIRILIAGITVYGAAGDLWRVKQASQMLIKLGEEERRPLGSGWGNYGLGYVYYQWNELDKAYTYWTSLLKLRYLSHFRSYFESLLGLALVQQLQGDADRAQQTLDSLSLVVMEMGQPRLLPEIASFQARLALLQGNMATAVQWAETTTEPHYSPTWFWETSHLTRIKVYLAQGTAVSLQKAAELLQFDQQAAEAAHEHEQLIEIWALRAMLEAAKDNPQAALAACQQAVERAEPAGHIRFFLDLGPVMAELLRQLAVRGVSVPFIGRILAAFPGEFAPALTEQEMQILALLQQGVSNNAIAQQLVISLNTVKKHNRNIYQKLGVHSRDQAIARAKALGLI